MMIKGINRQMIEIDHIDSCYFDRALLIMKPDCTDADEALLRNEATRLSEMAETYSGLRRMKHKRWLMMALSTVFSAIAGLSAGYFLWHL